ncbi:MAG: hypothetical protein P1V97_02575 [Planctomycetota bacterium]|nr:hypothetical protein [Planctomycetota bacterium]
MKKVILSLAEQQLEQESDLSERFQLIHLEKRDLLASDIKDMIPELLAVIIDLNAVYQRVGQKGGSWTTRLGKSVVEKLRAVIPAQTAIIGVTTVDCFKFELERWGCDAAVLNKELKDILIDLQELGFEATFSAQL